MSNYPYKYCNMKVGLFISLLRPSSKGLEEDKIHINRKKESSPQAKPVGYKSSRRFLQLCL